MINLAKNPAGMNASLSVGEQIDDKKFMLLVLMTTRQMVEIFHGYTMQTLKS